MDCDQDWTISHLEVCWLSYYTSNMALLCWIHDIELDFISVGSDYMSVFHVTVFYSLDIWLQSQVSFLSFLIFDTELSDFRDFWRRTSNEHES